jgi:hypothetical protein
MNIAVKLIEDTPIVYSFGKVSFVQKMATKVLSKTEKNEIEIKSLLNKVTDENYADIANHLLFIIEEDTFPVVYNTSYKNKFFSETYSKLTVLLCENNNYKGYLLQRLESLNTLFDNIQYSENEYENNKYLDERVALCCFFTNLYILNLVKESTFTHFLSYLTKKIEEYIDIDKNLLEEMLDVLYCILTMSNFKQMIDIEIIEKISKTNNKTYKGVTNKCIFKCMDIMDLK